MTAFHNSQELSCRSPFGAVRTGETVTLALEISGAPEVSACFLRLRRDGGEEENLPMGREETEGGTRFSVSFRTPEEGTLLWYYFALTGEDGRAFYYGSRDDGLGGEGVLSDSSPASYQITVYRESAAPAWFRAGIVYQVFPDRFCRGADWEARQRAARRPEGWKGPARVLQESWSDLPFYTRGEKGEVTRWPFFGGTLEGVREQLLYLKSLGAGAIYLNPIFLAASNHKYDTADYLRVDPGLGDDDSFAALAKDAEALGIRLILDGVFDHTGADSLYFDKYGNYGGKGACLGEASPYYGWFKFTHFPDEYESWWGVADLPKTDKNHPAFREFVSGEGGVVRRWLRAGAAGWRLDVADELPDEMIREIREALEAERPDGVLIGEVWEDASNKVSYGDRRAYLLGRELHSATNYPFRVAAQDFLLGRAGAEAFSRRMMSLRENYPPEALSASLNLAGSHDTARSLTFLGEAPGGLTDVQREGYALPPDKHDLAVKRLKLLSLLQFAVPGVPCVYYGDEAGLQGFEDPYNRAPFPWGRENEELQEHYRFLSLLRSQFAPLREGEFLMKPLSEHVCLISRTLGDEEVAVVINRGVFEWETVSLPVPGSYALELFASEELRPEGGALTLTLEPLSARVLYLSQKAPEQSSLEHRAGVLCALSSVPSEDPGRVTVKDACRFVDFLAESGQGLWQLLPLNPAGKGGSPFYSPALFALGPDAGDDGAADGAEFEAFRRENACWLEDYALYMALKSKNGGLPWQQWPEEEKYRRNPDALARVHENEMRLYRAEQFARHRGWQKVKSYAGERGILLVGDLPVYPAPDSADVWAHRALFLLDGEGNPAVHAGVPPDYFTPEGQDWGNPLYRWDGAKDELYLWWEQRLRRALTLFDAVRADHFRALSAFFAIPQGKPPNAGRWLAGPGHAFFREMRACLGKLPLIAEDLGVQDAGVHNLKKLSGLPGMKVWQFSAAEMEGMGKAESDACVFYSGTHDNQTLAAWCAGNSSGGDPAAEAAAVLGKLCASGAPWVIVPLQDLLLLPDSARMNTPGTAEGNWSWKAGAEQLSPELSQKLRERAITAGRCLQH